MAPRTPRTRLASLPGSVTFRDAVVSDAPFMCSTYNQIVRTLTAVEWEEERPLLEREEWLRAQLADRWPVVIAEEDGVSIGCALPFILILDFLLMCCMPRTVASLELIRPEDGYQFSAEIEMYLNPLGRRRGIGPHLWQAITAHPLTKEKRVYCIKGML